MGAPSNLRDIEVDVPSPLTAIASTTRAMCPGAASRGTLIQSNHCHVLHS
jgi:hypothetical protein